MRGCARCMWDPTDASPAPGIALKPRRSHCRPADVTLPAGSWHGWGDGFAAHPDLAAGFPWMARRAAVAVARGVAELAHGRASGPAKAGRRGRRAPLCSPSRGAHDRGARTPACGSDAMATMPASHVERIVWRPLTVEDLAYVARARGADPPRAVDARQLPRCACRRLPARGGRAGRPHRRVRRAHAGARRSAVAQPVGRAGCTPRGPRPPAAAPFVDDPMRLGAEQMFLEVRVGNTPAIALYESAGFVRIAPACRVLPADAGHGHPRGRAGDAPTARASPGPRPLVHDGDARGDPRRARPRAHLAPAAFGGGARAAWPTRSPATSARCASRPSTSMRSLADVAACVACGLCRTAQRRPWRRRRTRRLDVRRRSARRRGGRVGRAVRRAGRAAARQHARVARHRPRERSVYIANVLKCRPPNNRTPEPAEVAACRPYLERQIELVAPKLIVALGTQRGVHAARRRCDDREPARPRASATRAAARRDLPSGVSAAQPAREGEGVGRPAVRARRRCATAQRARRRASCIARACVRGTNPHIRVAGTFCPPGTRGGNMLLQRLATLFAVLATAGARRLRLQRPATAGRRHQGVVVRGSQPVPAPRRSRAQPRQHGQGLRRARAAGADRGDECARQRRRDPRNARAHQRSGRVPASSSRRRTSCRARCRG